MKINLTKRTIQQTRSSLFWLRENAAQAVVLSLFAIISMLPTQAEAITIAGDDYERILTVTTRDDLGFWPKMGKFYTFINNDNYIKPNRIRKVTFNDTGLSSREFDDVFLSGHTDESKSNLSDGVFRLYGDNNTLLISATYVENGSLDVIRKRGRKGQLDVDGVFDVTGGLLFDQGVISTRIFLDVAFDYVWQNKYKDLKARHGTYTIYDYVGGVVEPPPPPPTEVPEPMSLGLLLTGLAGAARVRKRK